MLNRQKLTYSRRTFSIHGCGGRVTNLRLRAGVRLKKMDGRLYLYMFVDRLLIADRMCSGVAGV
jgi:hypothetical protein